MRVIVCLLLLSTLIFSGQLLAGAEKNAIKKITDTFYRHEPVELSKSAGLVKRNGKSLTLQLTSGKSVRLTNSDACNNFDDCTFYVYRGLLANRQFYRLDVSYYEGGTTLLISRKTGEKFDVIDEPHVSPNNQYIVSASEQEAYGPAGVYLWEIRAGSLIKRFVFEPSEYKLYRFSRWNNSSIVELITTTHAPKDACSENSNAKFPLVEFPVHLVSRKGAWELDEAIENEKIKCM